MLRNAIIIFVRHPQLGKVKTRLATTLGNDVALAIYKKLLEHTKKVVDDVLADKFVFYADEVPQYDMWNDYFKVQQLQTNDLGQRMQAAFQFVFNLGYEKICIIGSDCYQLNTSIIKTAFSDLTNSDFTIGPATDGGYYLLGMKQMHRFLFENIVWSSDTVFINTVTSIESNKFTYTTLPTLTDVDEAKDVPNEWL